MAETNAKLSAAGQHIDNPATNSAGTSIWSDRVTYKGTRKKGSWLNQFFKDEFDQVTAFTKREGLAIKALPMKVPLVAHARDRAVAVTHPNQQPTRHHSLDQLHHTQPVGIHPA